MKEKKNPQAVKLCECPRRRDLMHQPGCTKWGDLRPDKTQAVKPSPLPHLSTCRSRSSRGGFCDCGVENRAPLCELDGFEMLYDGTVMAHAGDHVTEGEWEDLMGPIVRAVNAHAGLVDNVEWALEQLTRPANPSKANIIQAVHYLKTALRAAGEEV